VCAIVGQVATVVARFETLFPISRETPCFLYKDQELKLIREIITG